MYKICYFRYSLPKSTRVFPVQAIFNTLQKLVLVWSSRNGAKGFQTALTGNKKKNWMVSSTSHSVKTEIHSPFPRPPSPKKSLPQLSSLLTLPNYLSPSIPLNSKIQRIGEKRRRRWGARPKVECKKMERKGGNKQINPAEEEKKKEKRREKSQNLAASGTREQRVRFFYE